jgi:hypothetical protein
VCRTINQVECVLHGEPNTGLTFCLGFHLPPRHHHLDRFGSPGESVLQHGLLLCSDQSGKACQSDTKILHGRRKHAPKAQLTAM